MAASRPLCGGYGEPLARQQAHFQVSAALSIRHFSGVMFGIQRCTPVCRALVLCRPFSHSQPMHRKKKRRGSKHEMGGASPSELPTVEEKLLQMVAEEERHLVSGALEHEQVTEIPSAPSGPIARQNDFDVLQRDVSEHRQNYQEIDFSDEVQTVSVCVCVCVGASADAGVGFGCVCKCVGLSVRVALVCA